MSTKPPDTDALPIIHDIHSRIHSEGEWHVLREYFYLWNDNNIKKHLRNLCKIYFKEFRAAQQERKNNEGEII